MITIRIKPARRILGGRRQFKFEIVAANNRRIDPRDTYANIRDIRDVMRDLVNGPQAVKLEYPNGTTEQLRPQRGGPISW